MARPISGLFEQLHVFGKTCAMYDGWEPIRDVARPGSLTFSEHIYAYSEESADTSLTEQAIARIQQSSPDFVFLYLVDTDDKGGHDWGWMTESYLNRICIALDNICRVVEACDDN